MAHGLASLVWPRRREERIRRRRSRLAQILLGAVALTAVFTAPPARADAYTPPPIRHVWVIVLENSSFNKVAPFCCSPFNTPGYSPYLANVLTKQGNLLTQYWGTGHNSLDNYIAMVSGQSPTPGTQSDAIFCAGGVAAPNRVSDDIPNESPVDPNGQIVGQGCTYPSKVKTLGDQLDANGLTWKGYMQDLRDEISREGADCPTEERNNPGGGDTYLKKHDPFQWFHSIIDDQSRCLSHDVGMWDLARDLQ